MKRCILHLGMPKTASTSIQSTLSRNRTLLKKHGWEYPQFKCPQHGYNFKLHNEPLCRLFFPKHPFHVQRDVKNGVIDLNIQQEGIRGQLENFCQGTSKLILSSEALLLPVPLKRVHDYISSHGYEIEPIIYVRSPYSYRVSLYQSLLKFSQFPKPVTINHLQTPIVKKAVKSAMDVFGGAVKFYPFNHLGKSGVDVVRHFFSHLLSEEENNSIKIVQENVSLSWQATSLLDYIEEKSPLYMGDIQNIDRKPGDIKPLHQIAGEKFQFEHEQLDLFKDIVTFENNWIKDSLGEEFCDQDYFSLVATEQMKWGEKSAQSLVNVFAEVPVKIQWLVYDYLANIAQFATSQLKNDTVRCVRRELKKNKQSWSRYRLMQFFPTDTRRGNFVRHIYGSFKKR